MKIVHPKFLSSDDSVSDDFLKRGGDLYEQLFGSIPCRPPAGIRRKKEKDKPDKKSPYQNFVKAR